MPGGLKEGQRFKCGIRFVFLVNGYHYIPRCERLFSTSFSFGLLFGSFSRHVLSLEAFQLSLVTRILPWEALEIALTVLVWCYNSHIMDVPTPIQGVCQFLYNPSGGLRWQGSKLLRRSRSVFCCFLLF